MEQIDISQKLYEKYYDKLMNNQEFKQYIINFNQNIILTHFINSFDNFSISHNLNQNSTRINYILNEISEIMLNYHNIIQYLKLNNLNPIWTLYDFKKKIDNLKTCISQIPNLNKNMKTNQILNNIIGINNDLSKLKNHYIENNSDKNEKIYIFIKDIKDQLKNIEHDYNKIDIEDYPNLEKTRIKQNDEIYTFVRPLYSKSPGILKAPSPLIIENEIVEENDDSIQNIDFILNSNTNENINVNKNENENSSINENIISNENENQNENQNIISHPEPISSSISINDLNLVNLDSITPNISETQNIIIPVDEYNQLSKDSEDYNKLLPFKTFSSQKLGVIGESFVCEILDQLNYPYSLTTKIPHVGDIRLTFDNFIIMFEIKNKKNIIPEDITKFKSDINNLKTVTNKPVCGCFISLVSNSILNISNLQFSIYETYIPHDNLNISTIQIYIESLKSIFQFCPENNQNNIALIISKLNDEIINYSSELEICQKHAEYSLELNKDMINLKLSLENKLNVLKSILSGINPEFNKEVEVKKELTNYIINNKKWTLKECKNIINKHKFMKVFKNKTELLNYLNISNSN